MRKINFVQYILLLLMIFSSCGLGEEGPEFYEQIYVYEYSIGNHKKTEIMSFEINSSYPFIQYLNNSNDKVIADITKFYFVKENGNIHTVDMDSIHISENSYFNISPNNKELIFSGFTNVNSVNGRKSIKQGLYIFDLITENIYPYLIDNTGLCKFPIYSKSGDRILFKMKGYNQDYLSKLVVMNRDQTNRITIDSNNFDLIKYGQFSEDEHSIYYYTAPDKIMKYSINDGKIEPIISDEFFLNGIFIYEYPHFNLFKNDIYYYSQDQSTKCSPSYIYKKNLVSGITENLFSGVKPMYVNDKLVLYKKDICSTQNASELYLEIDNKTVLISNGNYGTVSDDNTKVLFYWNKREKY